TSVQGIQQAQPERQEATAALKQNPQDEQAKQRLENANQALQQNGTILDPMFKGQHGDKYPKMLAKGSGIADKNADTPDRKAAINAMRKSMGVGAGAAGILSQLPQTQQLDPQAQRTLALQQAGVMGKPATAGQILQSETAMRGQDIKAVTDRMRLAIQQGTAFDKIQMTGQLNGIEVTRGDGGNPQFHVMSPEERAKVPYLKAKDDLSAARTAAQNAMADAKMN